MGEIFGIGKCPILWMGVGEPRAIAADPCAIDSRRNRCQCLACQSRQQDLHFVRSARPFRGAPESVHAWRGRGISGGCRCQALALAGEPMPIRFARNRRITVMCKRSFCKPIWRKLRRKLRPSRCCFAATPIRSNCQKSPARPASSQDVSIAPAFFDVGLQNQRQQQRRGDAI